MKFGFQFITSPDAQNHGITLGVVLAKRCKLQLASGFPDHCSFNFDANAVKMLLLLIKICFQKILHEWKMVGGICVMED